jgi:hypothetical protein
VHRTSIFCLHMQCTKSSEINEKPKKTTANNAIQL